MTYGERLRFVKQCHSTEGGAACVAMLTGGTLVEARNVIRFGNQENYRTYPGDLRLALRNSGIRLGRQVSCASWDALKARAVKALAAIRYQVMRNGAERWHWVVFDGTGKLPRILDPERGARNDFGRMHIKWYHLVDQL